MKFKNGFVLRRILGDAVIVATGEAAKVFSGMVKLNETAAQILEDANAGLSKEDIAAKMSKEYEIDIETAKSDVDKIIAEMVAAGVIEE